VSGEDTAGGAYRQQTSKVCPQTSATLAIVALHPSTPRTTLSPHPIDNLALVLENNAVYRHHLFVPMPFGAAHQERVLRNAL
jgi:hypothetical protein